METERAQVLTNTPTQPEYGAHGSGKDLASKNNMGKQLKKTHVQECTYIYTDKNNNR